ncbi:MAG TPA: hypothetical protein VIF61_09470 [Methylocystis sp.]|jgi:hypothetical protein
MHDGGARPSRAAARALREPEKPRPVDIANRSTWRRPRRALAESVAMQFGYFMLTAASADAVLRWLRVF